MVAAIFQQRHFSREEWSAEQLGWKRVLAAFGLAALICHRRKFMLLQKPALKSWEESTHPTVLVCCSVQKLLCSAKNTHMEKTSFCQHHYHQRKKKNKSNQASPITTTSSFHLIFMVVAPRVDSYKALSNSFWSGLWSPLCGSCSRPTAVIATGFWSPTPQLQLWPFRDRSSTVPRKHSLQQ